MTRNRRTARDAGTRFATGQAHYFAAVCEDDGIERREKNGAKDRGDLTGLRHLGLRIVVECKDFGGELRVGEWLREAERERGNDDAGVAVVIAKRRAHTDPADQIVLMTSRDLAALLTGSRPA